jgi:hypothetical protein
MALLQPQNKLNFKIVSEGKLATRLIIQEVIAIALAQNSAVMNQVCSVDNAQCFPDVVVSYQYPNSTIFKRNGNFLQIANADGIDATERFVQKQKPWLQKQSSGDF